MYCTARFSNANKWLPAYSKTAECQCTVAMQLYLQTSTTRGAANLIRFVAISTPISSLSPSSANAATNAPAKFSKPALPVFNSLNPQTRLELLILFPKIGLSNFNRKSSSPASRPCSGGASSHGPKLRVAAAPGPGFPDDAEASAALAPSRGGPCFHGLITDPLHSRSARPLLPRPRHGARPLFPGLVTDPLHRRGSESSLCKGHRRFVNISGVAEPHGTLQRPVGPGLRLLLGVHRPQWIG
ncbi:unnamed protein product [Miscanthus lutarioriparius]|uniref:Uncharacterized protein n=1 Tax=Miscanthus lutarioriparius TaxID=422564 RepID=A0A811P7P8_9POAL|nr:unnamed protein product [Miscanthus lutarioriparius]